MSPAGFLFCFVCLIKESLLFSGVLCFDDRWVLCFLGNLILFRVPQDACFLGSRFHPFSDRYRRNYDSVFFFLVAG